MAKRVKPVPASLPVIQTLEDADATLARIAAHKRQIALVELGAAEGIEAVKLRAAEESEPARQEIAVLEQSLIRWADYNKPDLFARKKSLELTFGVIGFRASTKLKTLSKWTWERVLGALKDAGLATCVRIKEEVDKDALKGLAPEKLAEVGVKAVQEDAFYYELDDQPNIAPGTGEAA